MVEVYHMWLRNHLAMTDVIVIFYLFWGYVLTEKQLLLCMADLIANVADVIANLLIDIILADVVAND